MLIEKIRIDLKEAMKAQDTLKMSVLRMAISAVNYKTTELSDENVAEVLNKEAKKRKEAITLFLEGGREDLASKEEAELKILDVYLPKLMSEADIKKNIDKIISNFPAQGFGPIMKEVMKEFPQAALQLFLR